MIAHQLKEWRIKVKKKNYGKQVIVFILVLLLLVLISPMAHAQTPITDTPKSVVRVAVFRADTTLRVCSNELACCRLGSIHGKSTTRTDGNICLSL